MLPSSQATNRLHFSFGPSNTLFRSRKIRIALDLLELVHLVPLVGELADPQDKLLEVHLAVTVLVEYTWETGVNDTETNLKHKYSSLGPFSRMKSPMTLCTRLPVKSSVFKRACPFKRAFWEKCLFFICFLGILSIVFVSLNQGVSHHSKVSPEPQLCLKGLANFRQIPLEDVKNMFQILLQDP